MCFVEKSSYLNDLSHLSFIESAFNSNLLFTFQETGIHFGQLRILESKSDDRTANDERVFVPEVLF